MIGDDVVECARYPDRRVCGRDRMKCARNTHRGRIPDIFFAEFDAKLMPELHLHWQSFRPLPMQQPCTSIRMCICGVPASTEFVPVRNSLVSCFKQPVFLWARTRTVRRLLGISEFCADPCTLDRNNIMRRPHQWAIYSRYSSSPTCQFIELQLSNDVICMVMPDCYAFIICFASY